MRFKSRETSTNSPSKRPVRSVASFITALPVVIALAYALSR